MKRKRTCMICGAVPDERCFRVIKSGGYKRTLLEDHKDR